MGIDVLGPLAVDGSERIGPRDRVVLQVLVVREGEFVLPEVIADALWGETVPASWSKVVQGCIARLRKALGAGAIETSAYGYRLVTHDDLLDVRRFERLLARARQHLADGDADRAAYVATDALGLWRGRALPDVEDWEPGQVEAERLDGLRSDAQELRVEAEIGAGRSRQVLEDARALVAEAPFRETRWALFARALYQSGRQTEALEVLQRARQMLLHELGLEPGPALAALERAILQQDPDLASAVAVEASTVCPYRGLLPYDAQDADSFFGRDDEVAAALQRLRERGVLAVVGASGTGKSSLVRAGVVPALRQEGAHVVVTTPGARPLDSLSLVPRHGMPVLVVDQAEEAVTLCQDVEERASYLRRVAEYDGPLILVLRADRLADLSVSPGMARLFEQGLYLLHDLDEEHLRTVIEGPARHAGLRLEAGLVDLLVREVAGEPGALPLLSHVLRQTWEHREGATLTVDGYRATGGVRDAVARTAESLYERLGQRERDQVRSLFLRLVTPSDDGDPVRARVSRTKVATDHAHEQLLESLVSARLLSSDDGDIQIAHEALAREWPRLREWLEEDVEGQRIFRHLAAAAEGWDALDRTQSELYRGVRLAAALEWANNGVTELTDTEREFLDASREDSERERLATETRLTQQRRANRRLRGALAGVAVLLVASLVAGIVAVRERDHARAQQDHAVQALNSSDAHRISLTATTEKDPDTSLLLALEANRIEDSPVTRNALLQVLVREPYLAHVSTFDNENFSDVSTSPDGSRIAVGVWDGDPGLQLLDARTHQVLARYAPGVARVDFIGNDLIAVGLYAEAPPRNPIRLLDAHTLKEVPDQLGGQGAPSVVRAALTLSPDRRHLAAGMEELDENGNFGRITVRSWDLARRAAPEFARPGERFPAVLETTGKQLFIGSDGLRDVESYDVRSGRRLAALPIPGDTGLAWHSSALSPDGGTLAVTVDDDVVLIDPARMRITKRWTAPDGAPTLPTFSADRSRLLTVAGTENGGFSTWSVPEGRLIATAGRIGQAETYATFGSSRNTAYVASNRGLMTWRLDREGGVTPQTRAQPIGRSVGLRLASPDASRVLYIDSAGARAGNFLLQVQDADSGRIVTSAQYPKISGLNGADWGADGRSVVATQGDRLHSFRAEDAHSILGPPLGVGHLSSTIGLTLDQVLAVSDTGAIILADAGDLTLERIVARTTKPLLNVAIGKDRSRALVIDTDGGWFDVDLRSGKLERLPLGETWNVAPSPDAARLAVTAERGVGLWDLRRQSWIAKPISVGPAFSVAFSSDGASFVTSAGDTVTAWDGRSGSVYASLQVPGAEDLVAAYVPGTKDVLLISSSGELRRWSTDRSDWVEVACRTSGRNMYPDEWKDLVGERPYRRTCPEYPAPR